MMIPAQVRLGPHTVEVRSDTDTALRLREEGSNGDSRADSLLVRIDPDKPYTCVADTVLHELLHIAWNQTPLRCSENLEDHHEAIVTALSPWLLGLLRDNPELVAFLTGDS